MNSEAQSPDTLAFSVKRWEGEYWTRDVPGGVESVPQTSVIWAVRTNGEGLRKIIDRGEGRKAEFPNYSPDGYWLYSQSEVLGNWHIYRCRPDGSDLICLTENHTLAQDSFGFAVSPDGARLVYTAHDGEVGRVAVMRSDGSEPYLLVPDLGYCYMASFSPDGRRIAFSHTANGYRLMLADLDGKNRLALATDCPESFVPKFTPDGVTIVFIRRDGDIYRVGADGSDLKRLTHGNDYLSFHVSEKDKHGSTDGPSISPDGRRIAFLARVDGIPQVFTMGLDGGNQRQVTRRGSSCGRARWSPDGTMLSFVSFEGRFPQLFVCPVEGGEPQQLTALDGAVFWADWRPSGGCSPHGCQA